MKFKRTVFLQTVVVALGLLLGASAASWAQPEPATLISPSGTITDNTPTYTWNAVADSTWYLLWVWDSTETKKLLQWYTAEEAGCSGGTGECSVTPETKLADDSHEWWIRTWNDDGFGDWSAGMSILVAVSGSPAPVPRTGQTESDEVGDDGSLQEGVPWPDPRFTDNEDGTVTDELTGLIWLKDADCSDLVSLPDEAAAWSEAVANSNSLASGTCGLTDDSVAGDWRLPNIRELQSLVDYGNSAPSLPADHPFTNVRVGTQVYNNYWTSTTDPSSTEQYDGAFAHNWVNGNTTSYSKGLGAAVWPVRGGN